LRALGALKTPDFDVLFQFLTSALETLRLHFPIQTIARIGQRQQAGFTQAETLVIVIIIGILAAIATPSYLNWLSNKRVANGLEKVVGALKEAQAEATRLGVGCQVTIDTGTRQISATQVGTPTLNSCFRTGIRDLSRGHDSVQLSTSFTATAPLVYNYRGDTPREGVIVVYREDAAKPQCVVVAAGIGILRTGLYDEAPTSAAITTPVITKCQPPP
jgi:Tfp pilus assembly protein FimT